ncbi:Hypothetical_protein [Hexamita inflata]|uniref:Hypothetical_protein n=1 Tax=Hexamita inflata TaxID=28002 RepID=A0AA86UTG9_9EUKA|nr:Hypothetical protein HINF_LOCUS18990 [Hexamita inflata]CAI9967284.1 Hypothetical protein HINF_LOCUS54929 [Hexamita inflata]
MTMSLFASVLLLPYNFVELSDSSVDTVPGPILVLFESDNEASVFAHREIERLQLTFTNCTFGYLRCKSSQRCTNMSLPLIKFRSASNFWFNSAEPESITMGFVTDFIQSIIKPVARYFNTTSEAEVYFTTQKPAAVYFLSSINASTLEEGVKTVKQKLPIGIVQEEWTPLQVIRNGRVIFFEGDYKNGTEVIQFVQANQFSLVQRINFKQLANYFQVYQMVKVNVIERGQQDKIRQLMDEFKEENEFQMGYIERDNAAYVEFTKQHGIPDTDVIEMHSDGTMKIIKNQNNNIKQQHEEVRWK